MVVDRCNPCIMDYNPYWLPVEELRPEIARAKLQAKDYEVQLILVIYDNYNNRIRQIGIDYNNPTKNINILGKKNEFRKA